MSNESKARSISLRLSTIARQRAVPFERVQTEFLLERMVSRIMGSKKLAKCFVFKGGYVGRRAYASPRYTMDLNAIIFGAKISALQLEIINSIEKEIGDGIWFKFEKNEDLQTQGEYPGTRFIFRTGIGQMLTIQEKSQKLSLDIGVNDFYISQKEEFLQLLNDQPISWTIYTKEVIVAEKLHSFLSRPLANSRSKDLFDLKFYLPMCSPKVLREAIKGTFKTRGMIVPKDIPEVFLNLRTKTLKKGWQSATSNIENISTFEEVFSEVVTLLRTRLKNEPRQ